jgi:hypothetical protein
LCRVQPPGAAPEAPISEISSVFPIPPEPAPRAAVKERRFRARAAARPKATFLLQGRFLIRRSRASGTPRGRMNDSPARRALRQAGPTARYPAAPLPPLFLDGPTLDAPDCVADPDPRSRREAAACFRAIPFGAAPHFAIWPSPHPRIRWTVASRASAACAGHETRPPPS